MHYTSAAAAQELNTDAKTLRRFLRQDPSFDNAGAGGRYTFTSADLPRLRTAFNTWKAGKAEPRRTTVIGDAPGLSPAEARDPALVRRISEERVDRLEAGLKAAGLHISQMRDRDSWSARSLGILTG